MWVGKSVQSNITTNLILLLPLAAWKVETQIHHPIRSIDFIFFQGTLFLDLKLIPLTGSKTTGQLEYVFPITVLEPLANVHIFSQLFGVTIRRF